MIASPSPPTTNSHWSAPLWRLSGPPSESPGARMPGLTFHPAPVSSAEVVPAWRTEVCNAVPAAKKASPPTPDRRPHPLGYPLWYDPGLAISRVEHGADD